MGAVLCDISYMGFTSCTNSLYCKLFFYLLSGTLKSGRSSRCVYASVLTHYEGLIGHPLDPIGCLFDILMSAVTRQPAESEAQSLTSLMGVSHLAASFLQSLL